MKKILLIFGTRPEAIKLAPLIRLAREGVGGFTVKTCLTEQHGELVQQVLDFFEIVPDHKLDILSHDQTLYDITTKGLLRIKTVLDLERPDLVVVQGDTTTTFVASLAAFYENIPVAHIEAGLRSFKKYSPFPEEINRSLTTRLSDFHFVPSDVARQNLAAEGVTDQVYTVGNTVIDALQAGVALLGENGTEDPVFKGIDWSRVLMLTCHRRESFGPKLEGICEAIREIVSAHKDVSIVYPVHPNPHVKSTVEKSLGGVDRVHLLPPLTYPQLLTLMQASYFVLTDSGGIQEEAPGLNKPVLVLREVTERTEVVSAGGAILVGTDPAKIISEVSTLLQDKNRYQKMADSPNPYGDGTASQQILEILKREL